MTTLYAKDCVLYLDGKAIGSVEKLELPKLNTPEANQSLDYYSAEISLDFKESAWERLKGFTVDINRPKPKKVAKAPDYQKFFNQPKNRNKKGHRW